VSTTDDDLNRKKQTDFRLMKNRHARANLQFADNGGIAQLVERLVRNEKARGSNPLTSSLRVSDGSGRLSLPHQAAQFEQYLKYLFGRGSVRKGL
jgi:hypothetical protein